MLQVLNRFDVEKFNVRALRFSPKGDCVAFLSGAHATIWDLTTEQVRGHLFNNSPSLDIAFNPSGEVIASASVGAAIYFWQVPRSHVVLNNEDVEFILHHPSVRSIAFHPSEEMLASAGAGGGVRLWNLRTREVTYEIEGKPHQVCKDVVFDTAGTHLAYGGYGFVGVCHLKEGYRISKLEHVLLHKVRSLAFHPSLPLIAILSEPNSVTVWDHTSGNLFSLTAKHHHDVTRIAFSPMGKWLVSTSSDNIIHIWDAKTGDAIGRHEVFGVLEDIAFSPGGTALAALTRQGEVIMFEVP